MSVASRIISTIQGRGSWGPTDDRWYYPGGPYYGGYGTESGMSVSSENAMRLITVHNCVRVRAFTIGQLPCHIMELKGGMKRQATDFYLYELLHDQPNTWMTAFEFWAMAEAHLCLRGNFYVYKIGLPGRPVQMLIPLKDGTVDQITQNDDYTLTYQVRFATGEKKPIPGDKIMHFRGLTLDGITGVNPIEYARESIGKGLASERHLSRWFGKGMHPSAVIKHPLPLGVQAHRDRRKALEEKYQGNFLAAVNDSVKEIMTRKVHVLKDKDSVGDAVLKMIKKGVGALPVVDSQDKIVGIVSERDFVMLMAGVLTDELVEDYMTEKIIYTTPGTRIEGASKIMVRNKLRRIPVVGEERKTPHPEKEKIVGIVTATDVMQFLGANQAFNSSGNAEEILNTYISDIMEKNVVSVTARSRLGDICQIMEDKGMGGLPVVHSDELQGIITESDILRAFCA